MQRFTDIKCWQKAHAMVLQVYRLTSGFPATEKFGFTSQLRRAMLSVPTNIAEGSKRVGRQEYSRFLNISEGSLAEVAYLMMVARDLTYITPPQAKAMLAQATELAVMLHSLRSHVDSGIDY
jgi:four helix bundle protein